MCLEIITDNQSLKYTLKRIFKYLVEEKIEAILIDLYTENAMEKAMELKPDKKPIILFSYYPKEKYDSNVIFNGLISRKKIGFIKTPFSIDNFLALYKNLQKEETENKTAIELGKKEMVDRKVKKLKDGFNPKNHGRTSNIIQKARKENIFSGTDQEIIEKIQKYKFTPKRKTFNGKKWTGIFCDIEGTLLLGKKINKDILKVLKSNEKNGFSITLWTGGNVKKIAEKLEKKGIYWELVSKYDFRNSRVEITIDNESRKKLEEKYNIEVDEFIKA